jgi:nitrogen fixation/metabolism regulation signal transduction histidine kinase
MITFLVPMIVMLLFWIFTLYYASQSIVDTTIAIVKDNVDNEIALQLQDTPRPTAEMYEGLLEEIRGYLRNFSSDRAYKAQVLSSLLWVFGVGILLVILQIVLLTVFFSHKLAGPIYRFEKTCHDLIRGDYAEEIHLRKHDEMQNLAGLLNDVIRTTRERLVTLRDASDEHERARAASSLKLQG